MPQTDRASLPGGKELSSRSLGPLQAENGFLHAGSDSM
jgi:hypothetical protein